MACATSNPCPFSPAIRASAPTASGSLMLAASRARIELSLTDDDVVLDVGGGASPFERADWVIDVMPYSARGRYGPRTDPTSERFSAETWVERDICGREP